MRGIGISASLDPTLQPPAGLLFEVSSIDSSLSSPRLAWRIFCRIVLHLQRKSIIVNTEMLAPPA